MATPKTEINKYVRGTNALLDRLIQPAQEDRIWVINGNHGRLLIVADDSDSAMAKYQDRPTKRWSDVGSDL
jgi:hypothetical protein